jgi:hypothetical protein
MKTNAAVARDNYAKAALLFRQAHALDKTAGLDKTVAWLDKRKQEADVVVAMAQAAPTAA